MIVCFKKKKIELVYSKLITGTEGAYQRWVPYRLPPNTVFLEGTVYHIIISELQSKYTPKIAKFKKLKIISQNFRIFSKKYNFRINFVIFRSATPKKNPNFRKKSNLKSKKQRSY